MPRLLVSLARPNGKEVTALLGTISGGRECLTCFFCAHSVGDWERRRYWERPAGTENALFFRLSRVGILVDEAGYSQQESKMSDFLELVVAARRIWNRAWGVSERPPSELDRIGSALLPKSGFYTPNARQSDVRADGVAFPHDSRKRCRAERSVGLSVAFCSTISGGARDRFSQVVSQFRRPTDTIMFCGGVAHPGSSPDG